MDEVPTLDLSSLSLSLGCESLTESDLKAAAQQLMSAFSTLGVARLSNIGLSEELVSPIYSLKPSNFFQHVLQITMLFNVRPFRKFLFARYDKNIVKCRR